jgi:hypothetical protein
VGLLGSSLRSRGLLRLVRRVGGRSHRSHSLRAVAGQQTATAAQPDGRQLGVGRQLGLGQIGQPDGRMRAVPTLPPVAGSPQARLELGERQVEGDEPVVRRRLSADRGPARGHGELDPLPAVGLARIGLGRHLYIDPDGPAIQLLDPRELRGRNFPEPFLHVRVHGCEDDVYQGTAPFWSGLKGHPPGRPGLLPHIRLLRVSRPYATTTLLPARRTSGPPAGQDLLLSRTVIGRQQVALRGPLRLRLASASQAGLAQPRTRAGAMTTTLAARSLNVRRGCHQGSPNGRDQPK